MRTTTILALCCVLSACGASAVHRTTETVRIVPAPTREQPAHVTPIDLSPLGVWLDRAGWAENAKPALAEAARQSARVRARTREASSPGPSHAGHSETWWHGVAVCEQGGRNDSYFGFFSYMDGSAGGGMSWDAQVAKGNRTIATFGDHAWAQQCVNAGYRAAPGG